MGTKEQHDKEFLG